jgi:diphosphomevalonate decarboxylase
MDAIYSATVTAPVNIATLKYWGKRDAGLNLPTNSSISVTLSQNDLRTVTTAAASMTFTEDQVWLNGKQEDINASKRMTTLLREMRALRKQIEDGKQAAGEKNVVPLSGYKLKIVSENNFPTAAGLASSAAGFAAFVKALADLYELPHTADELSVLARQGSGSACRSLFGGYAIWNMGSKTDGSDSMASQIAPESHWPDMKAAIMVVSADKKETPSTSGMQLTVQTSDLFKYRVENVVPQREKDMTQAILDRDFETFAKLTMQDSNNFHACCLDTNPPIFYLNDTSRACIRLVEDLNKVAGKTIAGYTFDAGPNAVIYYLQENEKLVLGALKHALPNDESWESKPDVQPFNSPDFDQKYLEKVTKGISKLILTGVGPGPQKSSIKLIDKNGDLLM